ncbi:S1 RNA-binding domain-containing protein [Streptomyces sp. NBC_00335]|uniref:S1 RNA-binding domain-containing protein n=1 Tax=unclassified Streptomyces TaxID=2593676 RepID=UPI00224F2EB9|nr:MULTISPECIES: S1 RNA-binding domain-containing protein [unclassified Streptomyces]MCX5405521.1 S1 RNA-binding domain-containing protein [Streptomyces sp. NBC_00086]
MSEYSWPGENGGRVPDAASAWTETVRVLPVGTRITGEVVGRQPFGVFLSVDGLPDAMGLARINRMPRCMELPAVGRRVTGEVVWHADHNHQVGVVLSDWAEHEDLLPRFRVGQVVGGRITKITPIGVFVRLADCVEGLVPITGSAASSESFREGREMSVQIVTVDHERNRILLTERLP